MSQSIDNAHEDEFHALTVAAAAGDRGAIDELLGRMLPDLRAFIRLRTGPLLKRHEAHSDIVQSVCREVLTHAETFQYPTEGAFRRWLFTTALRKLSTRRDHLLAERRDVARNAHGPGAERDLMNAYARIATPSRHAEVREELQRVEAAMEQLDDEDRHVIVLAKIAGLTLVDVAAELEISHGAARMRLHRALARLAVVLEAGAR